MVMARNGGLAGWPGASAASGSSRTTSSFRGNIEFKPTLQRQHDDARAKGQVGREHIFDGLLSRLDQQETG